MPMRAVERGHGNARAEGGFPRGEIQVVIQIAALDAKIGMAGQADAQEKVSRRAAAFPGFALAGDAQALAVADAGGDFHLVSLGEGNLARAAAVGTYAPAFGPGAVAFGAEGVAPQADGTHRAVHRLLQRHHEHRLDVLAASGLGFVQAAAPGRAAAPAEKLLEEIAEAGAAEFKTFARIRRAGPPAVGPIGWAAGRGPEPGAFLPIGAQFMVLLAFLRVAEDFVGLVDGLEFLLGGLLVFFLGDIGVVLTGQGAEGLANLVGAGGARDAESLVIIFKFNRHIMADTISTSCAGARPLLLKDYYCQNGRVDVAILKTNSRLL